MSLTRFIFNPNQDVEDFGRLFEDAFDFHRSPHHRHNSSDVAVKPFMPKIDVQENTENNLVTVKLDLPGMKKDNVAIDIHENRLTISGESSTSSDKKDDAGGYSVRERHYGKFSRTLGLPIGTSPKDVKAAMQDGVLTVTFPKTHPDQAPSRIAIA